MTLKARLDTMRFRLRWWVREKVLGRVGLNFWACRLCDRRLDMTNATITPSGSYCRQCLTLQTEAMKNGLGLLRRQRGVMDRVLRRIEWWKVDRWFARRDRERKVRLARAEGREK